MKTIEFLQEMREENRESRSENREDHQKFFDKLESHSEEIISIKKEIKIRELVVKLWVACGALGLISSIIIGILV